MTKDSDIAVALDRTEQLISWRDAHEAQHREEGESMRKRLESVEAKVSALALKWMLLMTGMGVVGNVLLQLLLKAPFLTNFAQAAPHK